MSLRATSWAWTVVAPPTAKFVLVALADHADEAGLCWPSIARLRQYTCLSERAVRGAIRALEAAGLLATDKRDGLNSRYTLAVRSSYGPRQEMPGCAEATPAGDAGDPGSTCRGGGQEMPGTPAGDAPEPSITVNEPSMNRSVVRRAERAPRETQGTRLPVGWVPSPPEEDFAAELGIDPAATTDRFRDYWAAQPGAKGRKADWPATWRNWCRREAEKAPRAKQQPGKLDWWIEDMKKGAMGR